MLQSQTRKIGEHTYRVTQLGSEPGQRLYFRLIKLVGPSLAEVLKQWRGEKKVNSGSAAAALTELMSSLDYSMWREFVDTFAEATDVLSDDGKRSGTLVELGINKPKGLAFAGHYGHLMKWLAFSLEVNYASFFDELGLADLASPAVELSA